MFGNVLKQGALAFTVAVSLVACGGGGGDPSVPTNPGAGITPTPTFTLTTGVVDAVSSVASNTLNPTDGNRITVNLTDSAGTPAANQIVTVSSTIGTITPNGGNLLTDANGDTSATLNSDGIDQGTAGTITISYADPDSAATANSTINVQAGVAAGGSTSAFALSLNVLNASNVTTNTLDSDIGNTIAITLLDGTTAVPNQIVNISSTIGTISPNGGNLLTNASGAAQATISVTGITSLTAGVVTVSYTNTVSNTTISESVNVQVGQSSGAGASAALAVSVVDPNTNTVTSTLDTVAGNAINITLTDGSGNAIAGELITLSSSVGTLTPNGGNLLTDASGNTTATLNSDGIDQGTAGTITVSYNDPNSTATASSTINVQVGAPAGGSTTAFALSVNVLDASNATTNTLDPDIGNTIAVTLLDGTTAQPNQIVNISSTIGTISPNGGNLLTNTSGAAQATISVAGITSLTAGVVTVSYTNTVSNTTISESVNVQVGQSAGAGASATLAVSVIDPDTNASTSILNTAVGNAINITLTDGNSNAITGEIITLSTSVGTLTPSSGSLLSDSSGQATATISSTGIDAGSAGVITVSYQDNAAGINISQAVNIQVGNTIIGGGGSGSVIALTASLFDQREYELDPSDSSGNTTATVIDRINIVQPATLEVRLTLDNNPVDNAIITTSTDLGVLAPASGQIITNSLGIATVNLAVGTAVSGEAGTITAVASGVTETVTFGVGSATLQLGTGSGASFTPNVLSISDTTLSASGNTGITVNVVDTSANNALFTTPVQVSFSSGCASTAPSPLATIDSPVTTAGGTATGSYSVSGCENSDTISATIVDVAGPSANGTVTIIASIPNSIAFTGANPANIALKGTGGSGRVENSDVTFRIIDNTGAPEAGVIVNFSLTTTTGGISLVDNTAQSNANGEVTAKVSSGNIPTPVRVIATISLDASGVSVSDADSDSIDDNNAATAVTETISSVSDVLVISTGLPDQNSFTIARAIGNPGGGDTVGVESVISVLSADKFNNPVPDGTAINFTTEFGSIDPSCTTVNGACNVTWRSQNPRAHLTYTADDITDVDCATTSNGTTRGIPCRQDTSFAKPHGAYSAIVAYALGEETFVDANGNGLFDTGEIFEDLPEVFLDHNDDGEFGNINTVGSCSPGCTLNDGDDEEIFVDFDTDGNYDAADTIYNGSLCSTTAAAASACNTNLLNVSDATFVVLSSQTPFYGLYDSAGTLRGGSGLNAFGVDISGTGAASFTLDIADHFNGPLPGGTTVAVASSNCDIDTPTSFEFGTFDSRFLTIPITVSEDTTTDENFGTVTITVTTPSTNNLSNVESSFSFTCQDAN